MKKINFSAKSGSRKMREKSALKLFFIIFVIGLAFISLSRAEELTQQAKITPPVQEFKDSTRIVITTSGLAKFTSYWLDSPSRLVVEFQTKNVVSKIESELLVNEGVIKRITSEYYGGGQNKTLKSLTFELLEKVPYKIWQEDNNIILDIQAFLEAPALGNEGKEVFVKDEPMEQIVKRLETMEVALKQVPSRASLGTSNLIAKTSSPKVRDVFQSVFWLIGLTLISGLGLLAWLFWRRYKLILDKNFAACEIAKLKTQLNEQNQLLEHEQVIRKTVESTSLQRENEFDNLKTEFQEEKQLLEQEQKARKTAEEGLSQKEKEVVEVKGSLESLKEVLVEKGIAKKLTTTEREGELWIAGKQPERRESTRLDLSKDYNRTIILRIESTDKSKSIKSFANNIGLEGLCFETRHEFDEKEKISVRLFFFGDKVPILKIKAEIIWKNTGSPVNHYGVSFVLLDDKNKTELSRYIESKITTPVLSK